MQALATPRQPPQHERAPPLSLRSRSGRVTPLPDLDVVELGRQACVGRRGPRSRALAFMSAFR